MFKLTNTFIRILDVINLKIQKQLTVKLNKNKNISKIME